MRPREWTLLLSLAVLWGGSFFFAKLALADLGPFTIVFARVGLAALALNIVLEISGQSLWRSRTPWLAFFAMGALNNLIPFSLIFWGQTHIGSGLASILNATTPLFTVLRPALQDNGRGAATGGGRTSDDEHLVDSSDHAARRAAVAADSPALDRHLEFPCGPRAAFDLACVRSVFPNFSRRRRHEPSPRYFSDPGNGDPAQRGLFG